MELQKRLVELRTGRRLSQEDLAEKLYVSRQTISNWERGKTYPDINSLLLMATYFDVSLDHLIKGDIDEMTEQIVASQKELDQFHKDSVVMTIGMFSLILTAFPLLYFLDWIGIIFIGIQFILTAIAAYRLEAFKKSHQSFTYKQIIAITSGQTLDDIEKIEERAKQPYQQLVMALSSALIVGIIVALVSWLTMFFFPR